jgi:hypothetical protein
MNGNDPLAELAKQTPNPRRLDVGEYRDTGSVRSNTTGRETAIVEFQAQTPIDVREDKAFRVAVPAYETFTEDGSSGSETLTLGHSLTDPPATAAAVAFEKGQSIPVTGFDTSADEVTVTSSGSGNTIDVFYISDAPATLRLKKVAPPTEGKTSQNLYETDLILPHSKDQYDDADHIAAAGMKGLLATDFTLTVTISAAYDVELGEVSRAGGTARATNALLSVPVYQGQNPVNGLAKRVAHAMVEGR